MASMVPEDRNRTGTGLGEWTMAEQSGIMNEQDDNSTVVDSVRQPPVTKCRLVSFSDAREFLLL